MDALPEWPDGTVATLTTHGAGPHAIPVSLVVGAGPLALLVGLAPRRESLARLRADPRCAITILAAGDHAFTAHGRATGFEDANGIVAARIEVDAIADHNRPTYAIEDGVQWRWTDDAEQRRDADTRAAMRTLVEVDPMMLPADLPDPEDDGAAEHLPNSQLPAVALPATDGSTVRLDQLQGRTVLFAFPRTGRPGEEAPGGTERWNAIPGARGCTPQACSFRDEHPRFAEHGVRVLGVSTQDTAYQQEAVERLHLPYPLLSDERLELAGALTLPTFEVEGTTLLKRLTLFLRDGRIEDAIYPVFPPDHSAAQALARL